MKTFASEHNEHTSFLNGKNHARFHLFFLILFYSFNKLEKDDDKLSVSDLKITTIEGYLEESNDKLYRILTLTDIHQALNTLEINQGLISSDRNSSSMSPEQSK
jgi:hypothetical protein